MKQPRNMLFEVLPLRVYFLFFLVGQGKFVIETFPRIILRLLQEFPDGGVIVDIVLVPALLVIISAIVGTVRVVECDMLKVVVDHLRLARSEIIFHGIHEQGMLSRDDVDEHGLTRSIIPHNGQALTVASREVNRFRQPIKRMAGNAVVYINDFLHNLII